MIKRMIPTGAASGIGLEAVKGVAAAGHSRFLLARGAAKATRLREVAGKDAL